MSNEPDDTQKASSGNDNPLFTSEAEDWQSVLEARFGKSSDEAVVALAQKGDRLAEEYLLRKYKNDVKTHARSYFLIGADHEDIVQEGMFGLFKAIRDYQPDRLTSFRVFSELCIVRQMMTAVNMATRQKHIPLNTYVSLNKPLSDDDPSRTLIDILVEKHIQNPEDLMLSKENVAVFQQKAKKILSPLERRVLADYLDGLSYHDIARLHGRSSKSIDNALQRIKKKLELYYKDLQAKDD